MKSWGKILLFVFLLIFLGEKKVEAQSNQQEPNRLSIGIMGSVTTGHLDLGSAFQSGVDANFEFEERLNSTVGFNLRYVATPEIALQTNVVFGKFAILSDVFPDDALTFDNNYVSTTLTTQLSLVRLFGAQARNFNLFGSFGTGLMFNDVSIHSDHPSITQSDITAADHPFQTFFTTFGGGLRFNLGHRLDSYAQYEYNSASRDIIDGNFIGDLLELGGSSQISNSWSAVTFGLQFKFGAGNVDADWPTVSRVIAPEPPPEPSMFERLEELLARQADMFQREINQLTERIDSLELALVDEKQKNEQLRMDAPPPNEEMAEMIRELQHKVAELESALASERETPEQPTIAQQTEETSDLPEKERWPEQLAIQRVPLQGERLGLRQLPKPLPIEIVLVPDDPDVQDIDEINTESVDTPEEEVIETQPEEAEVEEITEVIQEEIPVDQAVAEPVMKTETVEETTESNEVLEALAEAETDKTDIVEENREDIIKRADSLRVIESIEELDSTEQGMSPVRTDVARPETADLVTPKPEEKKPVLPESQPEKDSNKETLASADVTPDAVPTSVEEADVTGPAIQADADTTEMAPTGDEATTPMEQTEDEDMKWTWYALIAVAVLGAVYFLSNFVKPKSGSDSGSKSS